MKQITIRFLDDQEMRYPGLYLGDYYYDENGLRIDIKRTGNPVEDKITAIHELIEQVITETLGIDEEDILSFDIMFDQETREGLHKPDDEPGDDPRSCYYKQHQLASMIEKIIYEHLNINVNGKL